VPITTADKRATFRKMHETGCFVLPNPWDIGSARALQHMGSREQISAVVKAVHPKPVNLLLGWPGLAVAEVAEFGVRRISVGGSLARSAWGGFMRAAREIAEQGTFTELGNGYAGGELNKMFS